MSLSDFDAFNAGSPFVNGDGEAFLHGSLASPLSNPPGGLFCRKLRNTLEGSVCAGFSIGSGVAGGAFVGTDTTKAISLRAWVRAQSTANFVDSIGLMTRYTPVSVAPKETTQGYGLSFGRLKTNRELSIPGLTIWARGPITFREIDLVHPITTTWSTATWYRIRMDLIPTGTLADEIRAYLFTGTDESLESDWTLLNNMIITNGLDNWYNANGGTKRNGFYQAQLVNGTGVSNNFIDNFTAFIVNVP